MRIRFLSDEVYQSGAPDKWPRFAKGEVIDEAGIAAKLGLKAEPSDEWKASFLNRWLQRGVAVDHDATPEERKVVDDEPEDDEDLNALTIAELKALAEQEKIDLGDATKKADIIAAIELAREKTE